ncbi:MAG: nucleotidyltransferase domain-containing protein [Chitinimonas sp.]|nr:nucleotidyltransferase domain-containing protein [Chitinimonas sp.]
MLADFLLGPLRTRVLATLLLQPTLSWHVRELARHIGALPGSTNRELTKLAEAGLLLRQQIGNQVHYRANPQCPIYAELASLLRKTAGAATTIANALAPLADRIQSALIFGSVARGEETTLSDIDILVLGEVGFAEVVELLHPLQESLQREINPVVYRVPDFITKLSSGNTWAKAVLSQPQLFLMGNADDFAKLVGHTTATRI